MSEPAHVVQQSIEQRISSAMADPAPEAEAPQAEAPQAETPQVEAPIETTPESESEVEVVAESDEVEVVASEDEAQIDDSTDDDAVVIERTEDLARYLNIDAADLYALKIPVTSTEGHRQEVSLGDIKDSYQAVEAANKAKEQAKQEYEAMTQRLQAFEQEVEQAKVQTQTFLNAAHQEMMAEYNAIDWNKLKVEDPMKFAVMRQEFGERNGRIQQLGQQAEQTLQQQKAQLQAQQESQLSMVLQREQAALFDAIPEWRNEETAKAEKSKVSEYLLNVGYSAPEIEAARDHRAIALARKAMLWDAHQKKGDAAKKKVLRIGKKVLKPGARQGKAEQTQQRDEQLRNQMRQSGGTVDAAAALIQNRLGR